MGDRYPQLRVAAVQAAPVFLNREATVEKACRFIREAGEHGAHVIGFPEGFIPAHPVWFHFHPVLSPKSPEWGTELFKNAVEIPSSTTEALCQAAREGRSVRSDGGVRTSASHHGDAVQYAIVHR